MVVTPPYTEPLAKDVINDPALRERVSHEISIQHYAAIGVVIDAWADFEFEVDMAIWRLLGVPQALGACVSAQMISPIPKLKAYQALIAVWGASEEAIKQVGRFSGSVGSLNERRNRTVHDKRLWSEKNNSVVRFEVTANAKLKFGPVPESIIELMNFQKEILEKMQEFIAIQNRVQAELAALPADSRPPLPQIMLHPLAPATPTTDNE